MDKKWIKTKIGRWFVAKSKFGDMKDNTSEGRSMTTRKEVVGCVHAVLGKKKILSEFDYGQNKEMSFVLFLYVCSKEEVCLDIDVIIICP